MRIIAGEYGGRLLKSPPDERTRPMLDRVREAVFSSLGERVEGARVLDLFAGTGSLGLEAVSRGAVHARLVESDAKILKLLRENVAALGVAERAKVAPGDALRRESWTARGDVAPYQVIFVDSPYPLLSGAATRRLLLNALDALTTEFLDASGRLVFHAPREVVDIAEFGTRVRAVSRAYGTSDIWYLESEPSA